MTGLMHPRVAHNYAKAGYYPTDNQTVERVINALSLGNVNQRTRIIDPCAGEGEAISKIVQALGHSTIESYAVEYDQERAKKAAALTHYCLRSDLFDTVIEARQFGLLFLNPPYGDMTPDTYYAGNISSIDDKGGRKRLEKEFYQRTLAYLAYGGVLVFIIPNAVLDEQMSTWLSSHFRELRIYQAVDKQFKQLVIFGIRTRVQDIKKEQRAQNFERLQVIYNQTKDVEELPEEWPFEPYLIPGSSSELKYFYRISIETEQFATEIERLKGLWPEFKLRLRHTQTVSRAPLAKLSDWHLSLALAAGEIHGVVQSPISGRILAIRGDTYKTKKRHVEIIDDGKGNITEHVILTDRFVPVIKAWDMTPDSAHKGQLFNIASGVNQAKLEAEQEAELETALQDNPSELSHNGYLPAMMPNIKFPLGRLVYTPGIQELGARGELDIFPYLRRHALGDWGDMEEMDKSINEQALKMMVDGHLQDRIMSAYIIDEACDLKIWIITEYHGYDGLEHVTTVLLPSEY